MKPLTRLWHLREDPRPVPPLARRRVIVVVLSALQVAVLALTVLASSQFMLLAILIWPATTWFGWAATRNMTTAANSSLDERQRNQVLPAYRSAFWIIAGILMVTGLVLANLVINFGVVVPPVDFGRIAALLFVGGIYTVPWVPVAVLAWRLPDEQVDETSDGVAVQS